jgi:two-component system osmolarity sensor histidine kinase EnvZ
VSALPQNHPIKRILPRSLLARSLLIIVIPLILLQVVSGLIFWQTHWDSILLRLARGVAGDVAAIIRLLPADKTGPAFERVRYVAQSSMQMRIRFEPDAILKRTTTTGDDLVEQSLVRGMADFVTRPYALNSRVNDDQVQIRLQLADGVLEILTPRKRLFSSSATVFVLWMVGTSLILFAVATVFMRNQVKPIRRLAMAADAFGKGRDVADFKPEGAREVRQAAAAFIAMRERIRRQIAQRTDMLSGVSHDLRTPLTRMKLQLAMLADDDEKTELSSDVAEMEHMLEGYLAFARGEGGEKAVSLDLTGLIDEVAQGIARRGALVDHHVEGNLTLTARANALKRAVTNLAENAARYGHHVRINAGLRGDAVEITIDDDGPGIPAALRESMFRPFSRGDASRNPTTGGVGLGLTIARDMVRGHGGDILLEDGPLGGLRARIRLPV